jgi:putative CocE/NonD family hydrolase
VTAVHEVLASRAVQRALRLRPPLTRDVVIERDLRVVMPDGVTLLADHYTARHTPTDSTPPTVLVRSPYGRTGPSALLYGRALAERGFQVVIQSVRGTFGSGGRFVPQVHERDDGMATVRWIRSQPWFGGQLATTGMSYSGYVQWAIADDAELDAVCLQATTPNFGDSTYDGGSFSLGLSLPWTRLVSRQETLRERLTGQLVSKELRAGLNHLPLADGDRVTLGEHADFYQDWLVHDPGDDYWTAQSHTPRVGKVHAPVSMRTGWYDIFLPWMLRDYATLTEIGNPPRLTIGPWGHVSPGMLRGITRETIDFLSERLLGAPSRPGGPVRYYVTGADEWRDAEVWPPPGVHDREWSLRPAGELTSLELAKVRPTPPPGSASRFRYDPARPTPAVGGPTLELSKASVDNRNLERRSDVLVFTSLPMVGAVEVIGTPRARVTVSADNPHHDLFVRLCDVHPDGASYNVSDRLVRLDNVEPGPGGTREAVLELWPLAHRFAAGHRIRVQISGGAHPRYARNLGAGEPIATGTRLLPSTVSVHHDGQFSSTLTLPVVTEPVNTGLPI